MKLPNGTAAESDGVESRGDNGYGEVFLLRFPMRMETGSATVLTAWIVRQGRLSTADDLLYSLSREDRHPNAQSGRAPGGFSSTPFCDWHAPHVTPWADRHRGNDLRRHGVRGGVSDAQGRAFSIMPIPVGKLILLHDASATVAA